MNLKYGVSWFIFLSLGNDRKNILIYTFEIIIGWSDIVSGKGLKETEEGVNIFVSYGWMIANCFSSAFFALTMRYKIKEFGFKDFDTVFYNNLLSVPILLVCSFLFEGKEFDIAYTRFWIEGAAEADRLSGLVVAIIISSISAFAISYGTSWCVRVTSSTTYRFVVYNALNFWFSSN